MNTIVGRDNSKILPMSFTQEGFWLLDQLEPGSTVNTLLATIEISKSLSPEILESSLKQLVLRHAILRTTFYLHEGHLRQVIAPSLGVPLAVIDLRNIPQAQRSSQMQQLLTRHAQDPFALSQGPLLHCTLLLTPEGSTLLLKLHRIISDVPSVALFVGELASLYEAAAQRQPTPLPPLSTSYAEVAAAQRAVLSEEEIKGHLAYWKSLVDGAPTALQLPTDYPRPAIASNQGASVERILPVRLVQSLRTLSQSGAGSLETLLIAAWGVVLARSSGQNDLLIGTIAPGSMQQGEEIGELPGPWENPQIVRIDLSNAPSVTDLLEGVQRQRQAGQEHAALPFDRLVKELAPPRSQDRSPLFQALIRLPWSSPRLPLEWTLSSVEVGLGSKPLDLSLELHEVDEGLRARLSYRTDLFAPATMERLIERWQILLEGMVANPHQSVMHLPLIAESERRVLLEEWTDTHKDFPLERTFVEIFEEQVARSPEAIAAVCEGEQRSYRQLNEQANQLAHLLREQGVGPETLVALLAERGLPFLLWILAVFKAGGAYLPLDPHHPETRLQRVLEQSDCRLVLSSAECAQTLAQAIQGLPEKIRPSCLTHEELTLANQGKENMVVESGPESLMYVIYTSGSTGRPKGAMVEQRGMINHLYAKIDVLALDAEDTVAQTASQCFDISVWQFLAPLLVGGRVQIYPDDIAHDPLALLQHVEEQQVSILETVPSLLRAMLDTFQSSASSTRQRPPLQALRWLIPTGEALPVELSQRWLQCYPHVPLLNAYGPTECSDDVTHYAIYEPPAETSRSIPIGKAIPNMRLYVLDRYLQPVPIGVSGELYVGGVGVGRGYRNDAKRTAEAFVKDPFSQEKGARLYKTGDLGCYLPDGNLEFLGRVDFQVKLRGFRIELGEIEAVLVQHAKVREVAVLVREEMAGEQRLIAYVVPQEGEQVRSEELKEYLQQQVPAYMVPSAFVPLERLPLTTNGKLDRAALPVPEWSRSEQEEGYVAPESPQQWKMVKLWEEVLGIRPVGIRDDFFALGGDSLQAVRLFTRIEEEYGQRLTLSTLFAGATVEHVVKVLQQDSPVEASDTRTPLVTVQEGGSRRPFFFLHGQWEGGALYSLELARALEPEQPFYLLECYKFDGLWVIPSLEEVAAAHIEAIREVQPEGPYLFGGWCNGGLIAYEMARQLQAQGQTVDLLVLMDSDAPAPRFEADRRIISRLSRLLLFGREQEVNLFLLYRHLRLGSYYWRAAVMKRLKQAMRGKRVEQSIREELADDGFNEVLPTSKVLRQDWLSLYDWIAAGYLPHSYDGKITFFWTEEEPLRRRGWSKLIEGKEVDIHVIPGDHMTSRTRYLPILAEHLSECLDNVLQATSIKKFR